MTTNDMAPLLETDRLVLRAHRLDDFDDSAAMWADPAVVRHISGTPSTREASWTRLMRYAGFWALLGFGYWAVEAKADGRFIGEVGFGNFKRPMTPSLNGCPEAGWVLKSAEHGQGFATEAVSAMIGWAAHNILKLAKARTWRRELEGVPELTQPYHDCGDLAFSEE